MHVPSRRALREDPDFDAVVTALYADAKDYDLRENAYSAHVAKKTMQEDKEERERERAAKKRRMEEAAAQAAAMREQYRLEAEAKRRADEEAAAARAAKEAEERRAAEQRAAAAEVGVVRGAPGVREATAVPRRAVDPLVGSDDRRSRRVEEGVVAGGVGPRLVGVHQASIGEERAEIGRGDGSAAVGHPSTNVSRAAECEATGRFLERSEKTLPNDLWDLGAHL